MKPKAFTLIELLIVVAIIAILAAIAVPNFLEAQTRSKVSRARADMRSLATAIEAYATDCNNRYPWVVGSPGYALPAGPIPSQGRYGYGLTTPVAYITSIPKDTFNTSEIHTDDLLYWPGYPPTKDYYYATKQYFDSRGYPWKVTTGPGQAGTDPMNPQSTNLAKWDLLSKGPDLYWARAGGCDHWEVDNPWDWQYDPTNGTVSRGNIVRTGP